MKRNKNLGFETLQIHAGQTPDPVTGACAVPIYQTAAYAFPSTQQAEARFALTEEGNIYTRLTNPTNEVLAQRVAALEQGTAGLAVASGMAAITYAILNLATSGDEIVAAKALYGGTYNLLAVTLPRFGIQTHFVHPDKLENFEEALTPKTKAIFVESLGNPGLNIVDFSGLAQLAHAHGLPLLVDNTFASPYLFRPFEQGADVVLHSATKFIGGHGSSLGGIIVESGQFDWAQGDRFPAFTTPDSSYHGIVYTEALGNKAFTGKIRAQLLRDTGAALSPFNAFLLLQGLETLSLRVQRHVENTRQVVKFLSQHPLVRWVNYPELPEHPSHHLAQKYFPQGAGSIFTFGLKGQQENALNFINALEIFTHLANVADTRSLVIHPASTTHQQLSPDEQIAAGCGPDTIRLSIGLENCADLLEDLDQALAKSGGRCTSCR